MTLRNGRYVVPVKAEARSRVKGIVHDASGSGQTLFVEPLVVVELGNAWREAQAASDEEEGRILDELSALVGANGTLLIETLEALAQFDFWAAKANLAAELDAIRPEAADRPEIVLLSARHPGLTGRVVPIDLRLGDGYTALVITGPNTGGKTVALRTAGLLCLMHQAGLHVPAAAGSKLPVLRDVFADIGDEQSIAQSLSTFSGHLRSIIRIVEHAGPGTLVLLDELGAGTDPTEGSALAQALLDHFIRSGALVAATTHYAEIKVYAHETEAARNASVEFDLESLTPTYRLTIGLPGGSQAFAIAERLGLPEAIVADARGRLTENQQAFESTLASIRRQEGEIADAVERARVAEAKAAESMRAADEERRRARRERDEAVRAARDEAERLVDGLRVDVAGHPPAPGARDRRPLPPSTTRSRGPSRRSSGCRRPSAAPEEPRQPAEPRTWRLGDRARSRSGGWEGRIAALEKGGTRATLEAGGMRVSVAVEDLEPAVGGAGTRATAGLEARARGRSFTQRLVRHRGAAAGEVADRGVVAGPAWRPGRRGARGAVALPRRRGAGGPRAGGRDPRPGDRRPARRGAGAGVGASPGQDVPPGRAGRGRGRGDDRPAVAVRGSGRSRRRCPRRPDPGRALLGRRGRARVERVDRHARRGLGRRRDLAVLGRREPAAPRRPERVEAAAVQVRGVGALRPAGDAGSAGGARLPARCRPAARTGSPTRRC